MYQCKKCEFYNQDWAKCGGYNHFIDQECEDYSPKSEFEMWKEYIYEMLKKNKKGIN